MDLTVLAMDEGASAEAAHEMYQRCLSSWGSHVEGELDERIVGFYEELRAEFPDHPPYPDGSPWMSMPLSVAIDHVTMNLSWSARSDPAIERIIQLAAKYRLVIYDPQSSTVHLPPLDGQSG